MNNNIIFMGTPDFAVKSLDFLLKNNINISHVITSPDKKSGRGLKMSKSEVKRYSELKNIKLLQPENLSDPDFIKQIKKINPTLIVVVAFKKLPRILFEIPKYGTINLHASLLPDYRGAAPINWCLINNETYTGVSIIEINEKIDYGNILMQEKVLIDKDEDFETLKNKLSSIGSKILYKTINLIFKNKIKSKKQVISKNDKQAPKLTSMNTRIDWESPIDSIIGKIKGLAPKPGSWTILFNGENQIRMKILKARAVNYSKTNSKNILLIRDKKIFISTRNGEIECDIIQLENRKAMTAKDMLNGYKFSSNCYVK
ncbi:MAG TPA: methionyl-tRNA formyltransferase [Flavobacteriaceae bacterium]|nr:methionyl-tRNA formyltransferase [Flavobacteriaceae bacterium]